jgi:hypothetical protein
MQHFEPFYTYMSMNQREQEEFLLHYGPRKERKAIKARREAEKRARNCPTNSICAHRCRR